MDPLTHTLTGAVLADTGLARRAPLGAATLILAANLPDVDAFTYAAGADTALYLRRGWTHGILAVALLPVLLAGAMALVNRARHPAGSFGKLLPLAYLGLLTHPFLDWLNTYGIRLLMPFDRRWFYGDTLFIIDPWLWLTLGGVVFLGHSGSRRSLVAWGGLAAITSAVFLAGSEGRALPRVVWFSGLAVAAALRVASQRPVEGRARARLAGAALAAAALYVAVLHAGSVLARHDVESRLAAEGAAPRDVMVGPLPLTPLAHAVVVDTGSRYRLGTYDWLAEPRLELGPPELSRPPRQPAVAAALKAPCLKGMVGWMRYPWVEIEEDAEGWVVYLMDARYTRRRTLGFGGSSVRLDRHLAHACNGR